VSRPALKAGAAGIGFTLAYTLVLRRWFLAWGASAEELKAALPGDEIVPAPRTACTRAIAIAAEPEEVWPWLAQLGQGRGGWYSYDWLENLFGYDIHNVDRVVPELQRIEVGDRVRLGPEGAKADMTLEVAVADPNRALVLRAPGTPAEALSAGMGFPSWAFVIEPARPAGVRLIARWRCDFAPTLVGYLTWKYGVEPIHFVMERKMLKRIKTLAERLHTAGRADS
jgi:hypothetical protein